MREYASLVIVNLNQINFGRVTTVRTTLKGALRRGLFHPRWRGFGSCMLALALVVSVGGHWAVLQGLAWGTMLARYAQTMPLAQAVAFTFDGKHPCKLCTMVKEGRAEQKQREQKQVNPGGKLDAGLVWQGVIPDFTAPREPVAPFEFPAPSRADSPPTPPPRSGSPDNRA